jgi:hypothetical protein
LPCGLDMFRNSFLCVKQTLEFVKKFSDYFVLSMKDFYGIEDKIYFWIRYVYMSEMHVINNDYL